MVSIPVQGEVILIIVCKFASYSFHKLSAEADVDLINQEPAYISASMCIPDYLLYVVVDGGKGQDPEAHDNRLEHLHTK